MTVRTRFAPSPTGFMHVGNFRTGLFAWLLARHFNGTFILRLEDTDKKREVEGSEAHIMRCLELLGLTWDEGIKVGGPFGPYRQSERLDHYKAWAQKLIDAGRAYVDTRTPDELNALREDAIAGKKPFLARDYRPDSANQQATVWEPGAPLRFKSEPKAYHWHDEVMGELHAGPEVVDDFVLIKADGYPTYNFAHICDDADMQITHIIRGQEFLASVPNYLNLYEALGLTPPIMATVPHILGPSGSKKLSKRDGAKDILDYLRDGFLSEALINFIASLGWNDGTEQEIFSIQELINRFDLARVQKSGARFDEQRLLWMNGNYIRQLPPDELYTKVADFWPAEASGFDEAYKRRVLALVQERLKYFAELPSLSLLFFKDLPLNPELIRGNKQLGKLSPEEVKALLKQSREALEASDFSLDNLTNRLNQLLEQTGQKPAVLFSLIRIAVTQAPASPGLADTLAVLGKEKSLSRLEKQLENL